ncbi:MAG: pyridoxamine 5'-phosphate oxidase family protein [Planctomycetota bacterium]|jgi:predicted pyridoxine 5'-phosphate oxidase superfamily flavin-nucleotide-binding protein
MPHPSDLAFSAAVKRAQDERGSRASYANLPERGAGWDTTITPDRAAFIVARDSFYLATASADGQPYIQHRGGPRGFLKIIDETTLAFADYRGNRQYISAGNLSENERVCLFLMDYPNRARLKIWGRARVVEEPGADLAAAVADPDYGAKLERVFVIDVDVMDGNCPQHIQPRHTVEEWAGQNP